MTHGSLTTLIFCLQQPKFVQRIWGTKTNYCICSFIVEFGSSGNILHYVLYLADYRQVIQLIIQMKVPAKPRLEPVNKRDFTTFPVKNINNCCLKHRCTCVPWILSFSEKNKQSEDDVTPGWEYHIRVVRTWCDSDSLNQRSSWSLDFKCFMWLSLRAQIVCQLVA